MGSHSLSDRGPFRHIGIMGKPRNPEAAETINVLQDLLLEKGFRVSLETGVGEGLVREPAKLANWRAIGEECDLIIVIGGDGSMIYAGRQLADFDVPMLGINRGYLGFLTDVQPTQTREKVTEILAGDYLEEERFLLHAGVSKEDQTLHESDAFNDIVLYPGEISRMIEFEVFIDGAFVYSQRGDGLIISTPTGSTAYSLSAGGPILSPGLDAISLVPLCPHTLSSRPIVVAADRKIEIVFADTNQYDAQLSCDGQVRLPVQPGESIRIFRKDHSLRLLHPKDYDYFRLLRTKLGWGSKL